MTARPVEFSFRSYARVGGVLYLFIIGAALFGEISVRGSLFVRGDAAATAANVLGSETLYRVGLVGEVLTIVCDVALAMILYVLLAPVSRSLSLLAAFYRLTFDAVYAVAKLFQHATVIVLGDAGPLEGLDPAALEALAYLSLRLHGYGYGLSLVFFGCTCVLVGYLFTRARSVPRVIGVMLVIGGFGYLANSLAQLLSPALVAILFPWSMLPAFLGELALALWLTVKGVSVGGDPPEASRAAIP